MIEDLLDIRLEEVRGHFVALQETVHVSDRFFGVFLQRSKELL